MKVWEDFGSQIYKAEWQSSQEQTAFQLGNTVESDTSPSALQPSMHNPPQMDMAEPYKHPLQLGTDLALGTGKLWPVPKWSAWHKAQIVGWAELGSTLILLPATEDNCPFSLQQRTASKCINWKDTPVSWGWPHPTLACSGAHISWRFPSFCSVAAQQCLRGLLRPMGLQRAETSQCTMTPWCICTSTSPRNREFHLGKEAQKMTAQVQIIFFSPCVQNAYQFLCVVFLLPVMETHPASARK